MCAVSNIGDQWSKTVPGVHPWTQPYIAPDPKPFVWPTPGVSKAEFDALRNEIQELRKLLIAAKAFDAATGQPDCEVEEKTALIKRLAEITGVDLQGVLD